MACRYEAGEFSLSVAAEIYGLKHRNSAWEMVNWYRKEQAYLSTKELPMADDKRKGATSDSEDLNKLSKKELIDQLQDARRNVEAWKTLVLVAEEELKIKIVKKSGAKQSGNSD